MSTLNGGRNEIAKSNSGARCLLENWVEERAVSNIDPTDLNAETSSSAQVFKDGHKGLLTKAMDHKAEDKTIFRVSYVPQKHCGVRERGVRSEMMEKMMYEQAAAEVHKQFNPPQEVEEYASITQKDYNIPDFVSTKPAPSAKTMTVFSADKDSMLLMMCSARVASKNESSAYLPHDYMHEQPVTFWTEHKEKIHGTTQFKTHDTAFRKNAAFSSPMNEYWDQPQPYEMEQIPKM